MYRAGMFYFTYTHSKLKNTFSRACRGVCVCVRCVCGMCVQIACACVNRCGNTRMKVAVAVAMWRKIHMNLK